MDFYMDTDLFILFSTGKPDQLLFHGAKHYDLVHRDDNKLCPKSVQRCEQCHVAFNHADKVLVKNVGMRERTDKLGEIVKYTGNVYVHYLTTCLKAVSYTHLTLPTKRIV